MDDYESSSSRQTPKTFDQQYVKHKYGTSAYIATSTTFAHLYSTRSAGKL